MTKQKPSEINIQNIPISQLKISEFNVRKHTDDVSELAASIQEKGILQPLLVRPESNGKVEYGIVIGSRRFAAAKEAKLKEVPVSIRDIDADEAISISLIENLQRNDLKPYETVEAIVELSKRFSTRELAEKIGRSYRWVGQMARTGHLVPTLEMHHVNVEMMPSDINRETGRAIPLNHTIHLANALDYSGVKDFFKNLDEQEVENKVVTLAKKIAPQKQTDAQEVLRYFKAFPDTDLENIVTDAMEAKEAEEEGHEYTRGGSYRGPPERTELTKMGDIRDSCRWLWTALTEFENMPHKHEDILVDYIKPSREYRKFVHGLSENNRNGLHDWLSFTDAAIQDMLELIEEIDKK